MWIGSSDFSLMSCSIALANPKSESSLLKTSRNCFTSAQYLPVSCAGARTLSSFWRNRNLSLSMGLCVEGFLVGRWRL